jgi:hypothetical protein
MKRQSVLWIVLFVLTLGVMFLVPKLVTSQQTPIAQSMMEGDMMGGGMMNGEMGIIHQLFVNHSQIHRTVTEIPDGIRSVTESDNPQIAALIQAHVPTMFQRIETGQSMPMMGMSSTLPMMLRNADRYERKFDMTAKGLKVTETSNDPKMVAAIREHAHEVTRFVAKGMPAMMDNMMK